jgi:hypothetical protein
MGKSTTQFKIRTAGTGASNLKQFLKSPSNALLLLESPRGFFEDNTEFITITSGND